MKQNLLARPPACRAITVAAAVLSWGALAHAGDGHFEATGPEFLVNASTAYNQYWPRVSIAPDGSRLAFSFGNGQDPSARQFFSNGTPATGNLACNPTLAQHVQDEPEICHSTTGSQLVAWSERYGYDGEIMGIFGRIFTATGAPQGPEFQLNQIWQASQWRPLIAARPDGKWLVMWSGDWDGDAMFRVVNPDGSFFSPDIRVNTFDNGAQVDTAGAAAPNGRMLLVFVDFSGYGAIGTGTNLWMRLYDASGAPLQPYALLFPMVHGTELMREGYFGSVFIAHYNLPYFVGINLVLTLVGLAQTRVVASRIHTG